jgi:ABC-type phosphate transport system auxiliary subunit
MTKKSSKNKDNKYKKKSWEEMMKEVEIEISTFIDNLTINMKLEEAEKKAEKELKKRNALIKKISQEIIDWKNEIKIYKKIKEHLKSEKEKKEIEEKIEYVEQKKLVLEQQKMKIEKFNIEEKTRLEETENTCIKFLQKNDDTKN